MTFVVDAPLTPINKQTNSLVAQDGPVLSCPVLSCPVLSWWPFPVSHQSGASLPASPFPGPDVLLIVVARRGTRRAGRDL